MLHRKILSSLVALLGFAAAVAAEGDAVFSPAYFWIWNGRLDTDVLCRQLDDMYAHGLRNVCIHPFPKGFRNWFPTEMSPGYMTDGYLEVYAKVLHRARTLGMHVYLYDEGGWPSGGACGLVAASDTECRFMHREMALEPDGKPVVRLCPYPKGRARYPSVIERGTTERFIELTHEAYVKRLGEDFGKTVRIAFTDEPGTGRDDPGRGLFWTTDFADEFRRRKGYDVMPYVPDLVVDGGHTNAALAKTRIDVMDVRADLFVERYLTPLRDWCRAHGMMSGGHLDNDDTPEFGLTQNHGSLLRSLRAMDVPGVDVIWRQLFPAVGGMPAKVNPFPRYAASAMHQNGGRFALSESFGIFGDSVTPAQMKWVVDYQMVRGINLFVFGYYAQSNAKHWMALFEPHSGPMVPYWDFEPHFFKYIERTSRFLSRGRPGADIVMLFNTRAFWAGRGDADAAAKAHYDSARRLDEMNCDYDFAEDRDIANSEVLANGRLKIGVMEYRVVVLPSEEWIMPEAREKIDEFEAAGGIVAHGSSLANVPRTLDIVGDGAQAFRVMKRMDGDRRIWFVMNEDMQDRTVELSFPGRSCIVSYDPERDAYESVSIDGKVRRTFGGGETAIYVTGKIPGGDSPKRCTGQKVAIDSGWTLRGIVSHEVGSADFKVRPCVDKMRSVTLGDWCGVLGASFSGKALYCAEFDSPIDGDAMVDLGEVKWCASVCLNGKDFGARFFGPFRWLVVVKRGRNILEVTVANLLANQIGDDTIRARILEDWQPNGTYDRFLRPFDKENHESGLFGPVTVRFGDGFRSTDPMRVVLSFDDGLKDHLLIAAPMLEAHGWRGIFNIVTDWVGKDEKHLTWNDVRELAHRGHEIATHTKTHRHLPRLLSEEGSDAVRAEFSASRNEIVEKAGILPHYMCPPYVAWTKDTARLCREELLEQMEVPRKNFGAANVSGVTAFIEGKIKDGVRRYDLLHHGVSAEDCGGWCPFPTRKSFAAHLDAIKQMEETGMIVVTNYAGVCEQYR